MKHLCMEYIIIGTNVYALPTPHQSLHTRIVARLEERVRAPETSSQERHGRAAGPRGRSRLGLAVLSRLRHALEDDERA